MSSAYVRTQLKSFLTTNAPTEDFVDLTAQYGEINTFLADAGVSPEDPWIGLQFFGDNEVPITINSDNTRGKYRETGSVFIHVIDIAKLGVGDSILSRVETLRDLLRGRKIGTMFIETVSPVNFEAGASLNFEGGFMTGSFILTYLNDLDL
jgi:hypothetical protein